jgi:lysophospholipase L1-like esterase
MAELKIKNGDKVAILSGQRFRNYEWSPLGHMRLATDEVKKAGVTRFPFIVEGKTTAQILKNLDRKVFAKNPVMALLMPGTGDYNPWRTKTVDETFAANIEQIIQKLKAANIQTALATSYATNGKPNVFPSQIVIKHNQVIRDLAVKHGLTLIDFVAVVDAEVAKKQLDFDGGPAANCMVSQLFAAEILRWLGVDEASLVASRQAWLDKPGAIQIQPAVSVNTFEKLIQAAKAAGTDVDRHMTKILDSASN